MSLKSSTPKDLHHSNRFGTRFGGVEDCSMMSSGHDKLILHRHGRETFSLTFGFGSFVLLESMVSSPFLTRRVGMNLPVKMMPKKPPSTSSVYLIPARSMAHRAFSAK